MFEVLAEVCETRAVSKMHALSGQSSPVIQKEDEGRAVGGGGNCIHRSNSPLLCSDQFRVIQPLLCSLIPQG